MAESIPISSFLKDSLKTPIIDVRSPAEFDQGHIPGAINMPIFTNEERAIVGTIFKKSGNELAVEKGLEFVGPKMAEFVREVKKIAKEKEILVHCWRGGMRSGSMAWLFEAGGMKSKTLKGGYKSFRNHVLESFNLPLKMTVIGGETGSGKTEILHEIAKRGEQILDLEEIAHHRGSSYGAIGQLEQPTNEQFENNLFHAIQQLDLAKPIWVEDESRSIGKIFIPKPIWEMKVSAPCYRVQVPFEIRVQRLVKDYGNFPKEILAEATKRIGKRLGGLATQLALDAIETGDLAETVRITLKYYDKAYDFPQSERNYLGVNFIECESGDPVLNAELILRNSKIQ